MRSVKPRMYPIFEVEDRCCQYDWKSAFCDAAAMGIGNVLGRGGLGVPAGTVFRVDEVIRIVRGEVEERVDIEDIFIGSGLKVDI